jgi:hypothetical protein
MRGRQRTRSSRYRVTGISIAFLRPLRHGRPMLLVPLTSPRWSRASFVACGRFGDPLDVLLDGQRLVRQYRGALRAVDHEQVRVASAFLDRAVALLVLDEADRLTLPVC